MTNLWALTRAERRSILERTHALEGKIFRSVEPFDAYAARVLDAGASEGWAWLLEDSHGDLVGYNVIVYHDLEFRGRPIGVYNANVGLLPEYRGYNRTVATGLRIALPRLLREPRRSLYFHAFLVHPSVYVMMDKYADTMWPSPRTDPPSAECLDLVSFLEQHNAPARWHPSNPWVARLPTSIDEGDEEILAWLRSKRRSVRYFFDKNPHFREGGALVLLVPLTLPNLLRAAGRLARHRIHLARRGDR